MVENENQTDTQASDPSLETETEDQNAMPPQSEQEDIYPKTSIRDLDPILDVPLKVIVELGQTDVTIKDLLMLDKNSVIEINKLAGEPLEILINNKEIAKGEVVVVNDKYGIRMTDIINPFESKKED
jgi:flagellar motor switch protein FliN/FliY